MKSTAWRAIVPVALAALIALCPAPAGLEPYAWRCFALFAGVIMGLVLEPLPSGGMGLLGIAVVATLSRWVLFSPAELAKPDFKAPQAAINWALTGFGNSTVWLVFSAFMFAVGYEKTGLGRRIALLLVRAMGRRTLTLGYAIAFADLILAPFTASNSARSGATIFPIIQNIPPLYDSKPFDPSSRRIGGFIMWIALASTCVTSTLFLTALAPNVLAVELTRKIAKVDITWGQWFMGLLPVGAILILAVPALTYWLYRPDVKEGGEVPAWAAQELKGMGGVKRNEILLGLLVSMALVLWVFCNEWIEPATVGILVTVLMLVLKVVTWNDLIGNKTAWNTLILLATMVSLAGAMTKVGVVGWVAKTVAGSLKGFSPTLAVCILVAVFFVIHYMFASITAHTTAVLPVFLAAGLGIAGVPVAKFALLLAGSLGIMGIISPYATGPGPIYYGAGYIPTRDFWRLGLIFGAIFLGVLLLVGMPWMFFVL
jgi:L-tartrate/succinate antiporter